MQSGCRHPIANNGAMLVIANNDAAFQHGNAVLVVMWIGPEYSDTDGNIIAYFFVVEVKILLGGGGGGRNSYVSFQLFL